MYLPSCRHFCGILPDVSAGRQDDFLARFAAKQGGRGGQDLGAMRWHCGSSSEDKWMLFTLKWTYSTWFPHAFIEATLRLPRRPTRRLAA